MRTARSKLLVVVFLLVAISTTAWSTAHARARTWYRSGYAGHSVGSSTVASGGSRPGVGPMSGEPDSSQPTKNVPTVTGRSGVPGDGGDGDSGPYPLSWIARVWMARFLLGVR